MSTLKKSGFLAPVLGAVGLALGSSQVAAQTADADTKPADSNVGVAPPAAGDDSEQPGGTHGGLLEDIKDYYTAPLRWRVRDWAYFAGAAGAVAAAHHYDTQVRTHFIKQGAQPIGGSTHDLKDAAPAAAAIVGTWLYANLIDSGPGHHEAWQMVEAGGLATVTSYALKFAVARQRPNQTDDPNKWRAGGSSFPSFHTSAAFAVGAVLAESGNDDNRWLRRFLGYGAVAGFTAFERLKHNAHWLSDDIAGAAIGGATAHFILSRNAERNEELNRSALSIVPLPGGAMVTYNLEIR
jgi:PAP2 superfamily protein